MKTLLGGSRNHKSRYIWLFFGDATQHMEEASVAGCCFRLKKEGGGLILGGGGG